MSSTTWDLVYGRPPLSRDAILLLVAVALHLPLFFLQFKAPVKPSGKTPSFVEVNMKDEEIDRILQRGMFLPSRVPPLMVAKPVNLSTLVSSKRFVPVLPPPVGDMAVHSAFAAPAVIAPASISPGTPLSVAGAASPRADKGVFRAAQDSIGSLDDGATISVGKPTVIRIPTGSLPGAEAGIHSPKPLRPRILVAGVPTGALAPSKSEIKVDKHAGAAIAVPQKPEESEEEEPPTIQVKPRTLTAAQRAQELFPIHGALKDRGVDRSEIPEYPEWARKKGIASSVKFRFSVTADGRVKENIEMIQGSGYPELDELARTSLLRWVFAKLPPEKGNLVQDGEIEFRFSIK